MTGKTKPATKPASQTATKSPSKPAAERPSGAASKPSSKPKVPSIKRQLQLIYEALDDKKATDIAMLDLTKVSDSLDYFVIASATSQPQLQALERSVLEKLRDEGIRPVSVEGPSPRWVLVNLGAVLVHLMTPETREFYDLEGLWADAKPVKL